MIFGDESAGTTFDIPEVVQRCMMRYLVAVDIGCRFAESMQHLIQHFPWCLIAFAFISFAVFIQSSLMAIDCGMNCFSPELKCSLGVNNHAPGLFSDCTKHAFINAIVMVSIWRPWLASGTVGHKDISEGLVVIFSQSIITPELLDIVSHSVYSGLK